MHQSERDAASATRYNPHSHDRFSSTDFIQRALNRSALAHGFPRTLDKVLFVMQRGERCRTRNSPTSSRPTTSAQFAAAPQNRYACPPAHGTAASVTVSVTGTLPPVQGVAPHWSGCSTRCRQPAGNVIRSRCAGRPAAVRTLHNQPLLCIGPRRVVGNRTSSVLPPCNPVFESRRFRYNPSCDRPGLSRNARAPSVSAGEVDPVERSVV